MRDRRRLALGILALALAAIAVSSWMLFRADRGLVTSRIEIGTTRATVIRPDDGAPHPLAVIAHGFAGSRQMMRPIAQTLARGGMTTVSFDFDGHGRAPVPLSPHITDPDTGATAQLVDQTLEVIRAGQDLPGVSNGLMLVGHSMATDVLIRAAQIAEPDAVAAISMYSDRVTASGTDRLLIVSGQWEGRLRSAALDKVTQVGPAGEGETAVSGIAMRRAVVAPWVGHVGVLWHPETSREILDWAIGARLAHEANVATTGPWIAMLLVSILIAAHATITIPAARPQVMRPTRSLLFLVVAPVPIAMALALAIRGAPFGLTGVSSLTAFLVAWGASQLALLPRPAWRPPGSATLAMFLGIAIFALALDTVAAAFLPYGNRWLVFVAMLPGAILWTLADGLATNGHSLLWRAAFRAAPLVILAALMAIEPLRLGLLFTILPVLVLFWLAFGTMATRAASRDGTVGPAIVLGIALAWSLAASTPLFGR